MVDRIGWIGEGIETGGYRRLCRFEGGGFLGRVGEEVMMEIGLGCVLLMLGLGLRFGGSFLD